MTGGFMVDIGALRAYVGDLAQYEDQTSRFAELVGEADVTTTSWGIVGLFTKERYKRTVDELQEYVRTAERFLSALDERIKATANGYERDEQATEQRLAELVRELEGK